MNDTDQFPFLILLVALAAYLRLRIDWSKDRIRGSRWSLFPMLLVEALIVGAGFLQVVRIYSRLFALPDAAAGEPAFDWTSLWTYRAELPTFFRITALEFTVLAMFGLGVFGLVFLYGKQLLSDRKWMRGAGDLTGFLDVKAVELGKVDLKMRIRLADIVRVEEIAASEQCILTLKSGGNITVKKRMSDL